MTPKGGMWKRERVLHCAATMVVFATLLGCSSGVGRESSDAGADGGCISGVCVPDSESGGPSTDGGSDTTTEGSTTHDNPPDATADTATPTDLGGSDGPSIAHFLANAQPDAVEVVSPGDVTLSWLASQVSSCTASALPPIDGWAGDKPLSGQQDLVVGQDTVLTLTCDGLVETIDVTYTLLCDPSMHPPGLTMVEDVYANINDGFPFGESTNTSFLLNIWNTQFVSLSDFSLPTEETTRRIVFVDAPTSHNHMDTGTVSVSECPGDFSDETATCVLPVHNNSTLFISTKASDPLSESPGFCRLDPRKTYFINYVTSPAPYDEPPSCQAAGAEDCAMFYSESL